MIWNIETEEKIRGILVNFDSNFMREIKNGFFFVQYPSRLSRFYMRDTLAFLEEYRNKNISIYCLGCGTGTFPLYLYMHGYHNVIGADADAHIVEAAKHITLKLGCNIEYQEVPYNAIYSLSGQYDVITMFDFLYSGRYDLNVVFKSAYNALKPNGLLFFDVMGKPVKNRPGWHSWTPQEIRYMLKPWFSLEIISILERVSKKILYGAKKR